MDFPAYKALVDALPGGKRLPASIYLHKDALPDIDAAIVDLIQTAAKEFGVKPKDWDLVKLYRRDLKISFLSYPGFYEYPYPALRKSITIDLTTGVARKTNYAKSTNPPILHRRETFFVNKTSEIESFSIFTKQGEDAGLYENKRKIGFKENWDKLINRKGYYLDAEGHLLPLANKPAPESNTPFQGSIDRHKTAIKRDNLSVPMFLMAKKGYLNGDHTVLDYGCGNGDDARELEAHGLTVNAWDPAHRPDGELKEADIVNLGFVINVIEERSERDEALRKAFSFTRKMLVVSAMQPRGEVGERFKPYKDGVITKLNTFQKYYTQGELRSYVETTLQTPAVPIAPGVCLVFKDEIEEQNYFLKRQTSRTSWQKLSYRPKPQTRKLSRSKFEEHKVIFEAFWRCCLDMGRSPGNDEFEFSDELREISGSLNRAYDQCLDYFDPEDFKQSAIRRKSDLLVYFALSYFAKRPAYTRMPVGLQRDIKEFFGLYTDARNAGYDELLKIAVPEAISETCNEAAQILPAGKLSAGHNFIFHQDYLTQCPPLLRIYIGCAMELYGDVDQVHLIKAHFYSGKVSFMVYDDFEKDVPMLIERTKVNLRTQQVDHFDYVPPDYNPVPLTDKGAYV